jgi:hypothetical protein
MADSESLQCLHEFYSSAPGGAVHVQPIGAEEGSVVPANANSVAELVQGGGMITLPPSIGGVEIPSSFVSLSKPSDNVIQPKSPGLRNT